MEEGVSSTAGSEGEDSHSYASLERGEQGGLEYSGEGGWGGSQRGQM